MLQGKKIDSDETLEELLSSPEIVIYGAGHYGHILELYSKKHLNLDRFSFAVSSRKHMPCPLDNKTDILENYPRDCRLLIAVSEQHQQELIEYASELGFTKINVVLNEYVRYMEAILNEDRLKVKDTLEFEVHITEHCNLHCR